MVAQLALQHSFRSIPATKVTEITAEMYTVSQKRPPFYFSDNAVKKFTDFNDFWCVKS